MTCREIGFGDNHSHVYNKRWKNGRYKTQPTPKGEFKQGKRNEESKEQKSRKEGANELLALSERIYMHPSASGGRHSQLGQ